jgi:hypothetical protein
MKVALAKSHKQYEQLLEIAREEGIDLDDLDATEMLGIL